MNEYNLLANHKIIKKSGGEIMTDISKIIKTADEYGCEIILNESLKSYTTFKIGGKCRALIKINSADVLKKLVPQCKSNNIPYLVLGKGSNVLIDDKGFNGVAFLIGKDFSEINLIGEDIIECTSGVSLSRLSQFAYENSLSGLEFSWGIPGTVGGAVFMNAGAYGGEIKDVIISCECIDSDGNTIKFSADEMDLSYRHSVFQANRLIITKASFKLKKGEKSEIRSKMDDYMERRKQKQPLEYPSAGSTFKRPEGSYASLLIEQCGLKGLSVGGAEVSKKHSGFIINRGNASFNDVLELIEQVKSAVKEKTGYQLECEPEIIRFVDD